MKQLVSAEERRLFYVALTRARHKVVLFTRTSRISRFIPELLVAEFRGKVRYGTAGQAGGEALPEVWRRGAAGEAREVRLVSWMFEVS